MSRAKCRCFFRWLSGVIALGGLPAFVFAEGIQVGPAQVSGIDLEYSLDLSGRDFCMLVPRLEEERNTWSDQGIGMRYRFLAEPESSSAIDQPVKPQPFERFYVHDFSTAQTISGVQTIWSDELPLDQSVWIQLYLRGFACGAFDDGGLGLDQSDVDFETVAPRTLAKRDLIEITSEVLEVKPY